MCQVGRSLGRCSEQLSLRREGGKEVEGEGKGMRKEVKREEEKRGSVEGKKKGGNGKEQCK